MKNGKDTILLVQPVNAPLGSAPLVIGSQTESSYSIENDLTDEQTKFGRIVGYGNTSESFEVSAYGDKNDAGQKAVLDAIENKDQLKLWEVDVNTTLVDTKEMHDAMFAYVIVESAERSNATDGYEEISATFQVYGKAQHGQIDKLPLAVIEFGKYGFEKPGEYTGDANDRQTTETP